LTSSLKNDPDTKEQQYEKPEAETMPTPTKHYRYN